MEDKTNFKSKADGKEFIIEVSEVLEDGFVKINGKLLRADELTGLNSISEEVKAKGELVYNRGDDYDLYYYKGNFYDFYWDTPSGCIFCILKED